MSSKPKKSGLPETPKTNTNTNSKVSPSPSPTPRPSTAIARRLSDPKDSSSSPYSTSRRSPILKPKLSSRSPSHPDLHSQLNLLQDQLLQANHRIASLENGRAKSVDQLNQALKATDYANDKLRDALLAQKRAEEDSEIEKFRSIEMEQAGIEASLRKEEEWRKEMDAVRTQHAVDVASLLSTTRELQRVQQELVSAVDAKDHALACANDVVKAAEIHAEKNEALSAEIIRIKSSFESKLEDEACEKDRMLSHLEDEVAALRGELERAKGLEEKLVEKDVSIERLSVDLEARKLAESCMQSLFEEWKCKAERLQERLEEVNKSQRLALDSLDSVVKQLERSNNQLNDAESEISVLKDKVSVLEMCAEKQMRELQEARLRLTKVEGEYKDMEKAADTLRSELDALREEKDRALSSERVASSSIQGLLEEKARIVDELKISKEEEEKSKKAMESLASALHEVSAEARDAKEKLVCLQIEHENWEAQMEDLRLVLKATKEKYEAVLHDGKGEVDRLAAAVEISSYVYEASKAEWEQKELHLVDCLKQSEQEKQDLHIAKEGLEIFLKQAEEKADEAEGQEALLRESLKEVEDEVVYLQEALGEAKAEGMKLERSILDKERQLQVLVRENNELLVREAASLDRIEELSKLLEEATLKIQPMENGDISDSEREYDLLTKAVELSQGNGHRGEDEKLEKDVVVQSEVPESDSLIDMDGSLKAEQPPPDQGGSAMVCSMNGETKEKAGVAEKEQRHSLGFEDSFEKTNGTSSAERVYDGGNNSVSEERNPKKKKKALLGKFGSLLKKKGGSPSPKQKEKS